jgi:hypothetical protein
VAASVDFDDAQTAAVVEATTARLERAIKARYPEVKRLFLEVQSEEAHAHAARALGERHGAHDADAPADGADVKIAAAQAPKASATPPPSRKSRKKNKKKKGAGR